jgi:hypothetical protein
MTDNPFQAPADVHAAPERPFAPLREALTDLPRRGPALLLKLVAVYFVAIVSIALCVVPGLFVVPLAGWVAGRVTLGTADGAPPVPWGRMTLRRLWPTGAALVVAGVVAGLVAAAPSIAMLTLPPAAALPMSIIADVAVWPIYALVFFTWLRWVDDDHEEIGAQRALTDGARVLVRHAPTWLAAYAVVFVAHLPFEVLQFGDSQRLITGLLSGTFGAPPSPSTPLTWVGSVVGLLTWLWCWLALARLYRVAHPTRA